MSADRVAFPRLGIRPLDAPFWPLYNTLSSPSRLSRHTQTVEYPGMVWRCRPVYPYLDESDWRRLSAFIARLRGSSGRFPYRPHHALAPQGRALPRERAFDDGTEFDDDSRFIDTTFAISIRADATSTAVLLKTAGWTPETVALRRGDYLSFEIAPDTAAGGRQLHIVSADATADASGNADIGIEAPCRTIPEAGAHVAIFYPSALMRLAGDDNAQMNYSQPLDGSADLDMWESF